GLARNLVSLDGLSPQMEEEPPGPKLVVTLVGELIPVLEQAFDAGDGQDPAHDVHPGLVGAEHPPEDLGPTWPVLDDPSPGEGQAGRDEAAALLAHPAQQVGMAEAASKLRALLLGLEADPNCPAGEFPAEGHVVAGGHPRGSIERPDLPAV